MNSSVTPSLSGDSTSRVLPIDVEHGGIRVLLPLITIAGLIGGYVLTTVIVNALNLDLAVGCVSFVGAVVGALALATLSDRVLKRIWPSGRSLSVDDEGLQLNDKRRGHGPTQRILWAQRINLLSWHFKVSRGSARVPKGWIMLGLQLVQDDAEITLYTFMPEKQAAALHNFGMFTQLLGRAQIESDKLSLREKSEQRRLTKAENVRWEGGAEVRREDFAGLLDIITHHNLDGQTAPLEGDLA